ncbi:MAG: hypothetical protein ACO3PI_06015, partial [Burkholderiaceae bacterium]
ECSSYTSAKSKFYLLPSCCFIVVARDAVKRFLLDDEKQQKDRARSNLVFCIVKVMKVGTYPEKVQGC